MKNKLRNYFWFAIVLIALLGLFWWYISHNDGRDVAERVETSGFVTFYDAGIGDIRRIELDPVSTKVFRNPGGTKYLLQSENPDQSISIYDVNGSKLNEVLLAGEHIVTPNSDYVLIQKTFKKNKHLWEQTYDYGLILPEIENQMPENSTEHSPAAKIIMWGKSKLAVYDKEENEIYEELFFGQDLNIEKVIPCEGSRIAVFTSEYEYPEEFGPDWKYYKTNQRISFAIIDYHQNSNDFQLDTNDVNLQDVNGLKFDFEDILWPIYYGTKLASIEEFSNIDVASSQDRIHVAGIINDSDVFLINVATERTVFKKPLTRYINGNANSNILQIEVANGGTVHVLRHYIGNKNLLIYENYDKTDNVTQMHIIEDMGDAAKMHIDKTKVVIVDGTKKKTIKLM